MSAPRQICVEFDLSVISVISDCPKHLLGTMTYVRKDIADDLQCALVCLADAYAACNGEDHPAYVRAMTAIKNAKGQE